MRKILSRVFWWANGATVVLVELNCNNEEEQKKGRAIQMYLETGVAKACVRTLQVASTHPIHAHCKVKMSTVTLTIPTHL